MFGRMVHDLSPILVRIYGDLAIRWYGLSYIMGFIAAYLMVMWLSRRQKQGLTPEMVGDLTAYSALGVLLGGRLGYCLFYAPDLFLKFRSDFPFWGVFALNEGGMSAHGGMLGLALACTLFAFRHGLSSLYLYDLAAISGPIGIFFGRIANFINGELVGRVAPDDFPLAVKFPSDIINWPNQEPGRLAGLSSVVDQIPDLSHDKYLELVDNFKLSSSARDALFEYLNRIIEAIQTGNLAAKDAIAPLLEPRHPSQLYAALGEGLFLFLILFFLWRKPRKPGVIGCCFVIFYATFRILDEQFRMPDAHLGFQLFGLTRGQWLCIAMLVVGLVFLLIWGRREALPIPGWKRGQNVKIHRR